MSAIKSGWDIIQEVSHNDKNSYKYKDIEIEDQEDDR